MSQPSNSLRRLLFAVYVLALGFACFMAIWTVIDKFNAYKTVLSVMVICPDNRIIQGVGNYGINDPSQLGAFDSTTKYEEGSYIVEKDWKVSNESLYKKYDSCFHSTSYQPYCCSKEKYSKLDVGETYNSKFRQDRFDACISYLSDWRRERINSDLRKACGVNQGRVQAIGRLGYNNLWSAIGYSILAVVLILCISEILRRILKFVIKNRKETFAKITSVPSVVVKFLRTLLATPIELIIKIVILFAILCFGIWAVIKILPKSIESKKMDCLKLGSDIRYQDCLKLIEE